jgi:hypothetical protein
LNSKIISYSLINAFKKPEEEFVKINFLIETDYTNKYSNLDMDLLKKNSSLLKNKLKMLKNDLFIFAFFLKDCFILKTPFKNKLIQLVTYYKFFYFNKISRINKKKNNLYSNYSILIINTITKKPKINLINQDKLILNLTPGIIKKKLEIKEKNVKKSYKMLKMMMKISAFNIKKIFELKNFIIQLKGSKSKIPQILTLLKRYLSPKKKIFIYTPNIINNKLKFKKIKAIKRRLKKKFIKM